MKAYKFSKSSHLVFLLAFSLFRGGEGFEGDVEEGCEEDEVNCSYWVNENRKLKSLLFFI